MGRTLSDDTCEMTFLDRISGDELTIYYRLPTSQERTDYTNAMVTRTGNKVENTLGQARKTYGLLIMTGFKDGCFDKGKGKPLSSDPESPYYDPAWKAYVRKYALDVVELLAHNVFEASLVAAEKPETGKPVVPDDDEPGEGEPKGEGGEKEQTSDPS